MRAFEVRSAVYEPGPVVYVRGRVARAISILLKDPKIDAALREMAGGAEVLEVVGAIDRVGAEWAHAAGFGTSETRSSAIGSDSEDDDDCTIDEAARMLNRGVRQVRNLAAGGLGRKVGGRWLLSRRLVLAEMARRNGR